MAKNYQTCVDYVARTLDLTTKDPYTLDAKDWPSSKKLTKIEVEDYQKGETVVGVMPNLGKHGHLFTVNKIENGIATGMQLGADRQVKPIRVLLDENVVLLRPAQPKKPEEGKEEDVKTPPDASESAKKDETKNEPPKDEKPQSDAKKAEPKQVTPPPAQPKKPEEK